MIEMVIISYLVGCEAKNWNGWRCVWELTAPCGEIYHLVYLPKDDRDGVEIFQPPKSLGFTRLSSDGLVKLRIREIPLNIQKED